MKSNKTEFSASYVYLLKTKIIFFFFYTYKRLSEGLECTAFYYFRSYVGIYMYLWVIVRNSVFQYITSIIFLVMPATNIAEFKRNTLTHYADSAH